MLLVGIIVAALSLSFSTYAAPQTQAACKALELALPGRTFYAQSPVYNDVTSTYFSRQQSSLQPSCVVRPQSASEVAKAINILAVTQSKFAIKSGGHSPNRGYSSVDGGVTIDFDSFKAVKFNQATNQVSIQPGASWSEIYKILDPFGVTALGGRSGPIGSTGFLSGGGISGFSRDKGWGCDGIVNFEVVTVAAGIINANATHNQDLFKALKGGQNNFGVITRLDVSTFQYSPFLGGSIVYGTEAKDASISAFRDFKTGPVDTSEEVEQSYAYISAINSTQIIETLWYPKSASNPNGLQRWQNIQPQISNTLRTSNMTDFVAEVDSFLILDKFALFATTTFLITPTILSKVHALWQAAVDDTFSKNGVDSVMTWQSLPANRGATPNVLGLRSAPAPEKDHVLLLFGKYWESSSLTATVEKRTLDLIARIDRLAAEENASVKFKYLNYAHYAQNVFAGYGQDSLSFMRAVSKKYDPNGVFQRQVGGFKL